MTQRVKLATRSSPADDPTEPAERATHPLESERLLRTIFERADVGLALVSLEGRWLHINPRLGELLGRSRAELATLTCQDLTHPDDREASGALFDRLQVGELDAYDIDQRYVRKDGVPIWVHLTASLMRTPKGKPDYFIVTAQDITERKAMQALTDTALSHLALDDLLRELLDRVIAVMGVDNVSIFLLDTDGRTLTVRAARGLLAEYVGQLQVPVGRGFIVRVLASREPVIVDDTSAADFDGAPPILWEEHPRSLASVPLLVADRGEGHLAGRLVGTINMGSAASRRFTQADVQLLQRAADRVALAVDRARLYAAEQEARQRAEAALAQVQASKAQAAERAAQLHTILETMTDGVAMSDAQGRYLQTNRAFRALLAADRLPSFEAMLPAERVPILEALDPATGASLPSERSPVGRALRGEVVTGPDADLRVRAFDGRELEVNASAAPLREPDGQIVGAVLVVRDVTERNRLEREREAAHADELAAREASQRMEQFLATATHDLRTPLTTTVGFIDLAELQAERLASATREKYPVLARQVKAVRDRLEDADQSAARLARLLPLLFDTATIRTAGLELHRARFDLAALVRQQVEAMRVGAPSRTIRLHAPADSAPIPVEADADRIGQVMANYVTNALKYSPPHQPVDIWMAARRSRACVAVCDRGRGIPAAERTRVWELFHRVPGATAQDGTQGGSLGLGLHISKAIITAHGGRVGVKSAVGEGSTFWFTLPLPAPVSGPVSAAHKGVRM